MNNKAMYQLSYGLFVLTTKDEEKDNGCIINTAIQVTTDPNRVAITMNKQNFTHDMIVKTGKFNLSILNSQADFSVFQRFGFQSGRSVDKFQNFDQAMRTENGILCLTECANAFISGKVINSTDLGTHTLFLADVTDCNVLNDWPSITYADYHANIKPKPAAQAKKKGFICKICGYIYEGEELPPDFICPICKHGADDFEPLT